MTRQYANLENLTGKPFTAQIQIFAGEEVARLTAEGISPADALAVVNDALAVIVTRFPTQYEPPTP
jgi:uncharacterized protein YoaH (UPF0181 family)